MPGLGRAHRTGVGIYPCSGNVGRRWDANHVAISPDGRRIAVADRDGFAYSWDMDTPKSVLVKILLLRVASPRREKPRVTITDDAFAWADSGRANCILFRLVDSGHIDIASYVLKFLSS